MTPEISLNGLVSVSYTHLGLGHGETPIFPIHIFKVKEGVNYRPEDPNYDLFCLACQVSAKRLFPNFSFLDAPYNLQYYRSGHPETEVAYMGCRCLLYTSSPISSHSRLVFPQPFLPCRAILSPARTAKLIGSNSSRPSKQTESLSLIHI